MPGGDGRFLVAEQDGGQPAGDLPRGLLGQDGKDCAGTKDLDQSFKDGLLKFAPARAPAAKRA